MRENNMSSICADGLRFYYMHEWHGFTRLRGTTLDEIVAHADEIESCAEGSYGMLCAAVLLCGEKEVRRVGLEVHALGTKDPKGQWNAGKVKWLAAMQADADVMRLLSQS